MAAKIKNHVRIEVSQNNDTHPVYLGETLIGYVSNFEPGKYHAYSEEFEPIEGPYLTANAPVSMQHALARIMNYRIEQLGG